ncbi:MAG: N-acetylneuraminate synthase family protein [Rhodospirillaceae bacterium]|nr:N-acetylneuraminate synthase family protein [Rhodospirillaceae bacterium]
MSRTTHTVNKPWGKYETLYEEDGRLVKIITVNPGESLSRQSHEHRSEHWFVLTGEATVEIDDDIRVVQTLGNVFIDVNSSHRLINKTNEVLRIAEVQYGDIISEDDITRYADRYGRKLGKYDMKKINIIPPVTICEIGCNHMGKMSTAEEMIKIAAQFCNADVVKFQKRTNRELLNEDEFNTPHPNPENSYGSTYGEHREFLEFDLEQHRALKHMCEEWGVVYSSSVWDLTSTKEIASLNPQLIKIPSAINTNEQVLDYLYQNYEGEIHISLGMTTAEEEERVVAMAEQYGRGKDVVLYHCTAGYPVDMQDINLHELDRLFDAFGSRVKSIGFSGHHHGIAADVAALTLGATHFERHFTLNRTWKGTDHAASLEPDGFRRLERDLANVSMALNPKKEKILPVEMVQREKLKRIVKL